MCRLFAITSEEPLSPMVAIESMEVMHEGHDGSGVGLLLRDLGGPFEEMKSAPILSATNWPRASGFPPTSRGESLSPAQPWRPGLSAR